MGVITQERVALPLLTYEEYLREDSTQDRYDIIDGVREFMANPTRQHQEELINLVELFRVYQQQARNGRVLIAPCDVLIRYSPLRTRQPNLIYISTERLAQNPPPDDPQPLNPAPELVIEILSPSDTKIVLNGKLADYCAVNVQECWIVRSDTQTVEVLELTPQGSHSVAVYGSGQSVASFTFEGLTVAVDAIFAE